MSFDPKNFFVGLVDFFSILMPGAVVTYLGRDWVFRHELPFTPPSEPEEGVALFLFVSYVLGHFIFLLGASTLDDFVYDPMRKLTYWGQVGRLADGKELSWRWTRRVVTFKLLFGSSPDSAVMCASRHKARVLHSLDGTKAVNTFQWAKARLSKENPEGLGAVHRFEADSKFFRSFLVVLIALTIIWGVGRHWTWALVSSVFSVVAFIRYVEQRFKATQQAYWGVIALDASPADAPADASRAVDPPAADPSAVDQSAADPSEAKNYPPRDDGLTHAGGVVCRLANGSPRYLLSAEKKSSTVWELPAGRIQPGEDPKETAVRAVLEQTGVWAKVLDSIEDFPKPGAKKGLVRYYKMEVAEEGAPVHAWTPQWFRLKGAGQLEPCDGSDKAPSDETMKILGEIDD